jgi:hypothetical protein
MYYLLFHLIVVPPILCGLARKMYSRPLGAFFLPGLLLKIAAGWAVTAVFLYYYGGSDVAHTFEQSLLLRDILIESPLRFWQFPYDMPQGDFYYLHGFPDLTPSFVFTCKITAIVSLITGDNIWLVSIWFSAFSFVGLWLFGSELCRTDSGLKRPVIIAFFLVPSVAFWSAGLLKETLLWGAMGLLFWAILRLAVLFSHVNIQPDGCNIAHYYLFPSQQPHKRLIRMHVAALTTIAAIFAWVILQVKYYIFAAVVLAIAVYWLLQWQKRFWKVFAIAFILLPLLLWGLGKLHPNLSLDALAVAVHRNYARMVAISDADNIIWLDLQPDFISLIRQIPFALKASFSVPMPWESGNLWRKLTGIENLSLLLLALGIRLPQHRPYPVAEITAAVILTVTLAALLTLSSPNIGALARYKVSYLPLLWLLICSSNCFVRTLPFQKLKTLF